ncbi:ROK family transcriptional regulator [Streptomyces sp. R302]|uniref:ROK family transcriptional regulator n=1 Tax=unclassified Streptomyces TaxID=2593676 RepID=UPI00145D76D4|nr:MULTISPECIES: ROK family transcriptional regulator [unclassified Streptomyces]NML48868.1 ROK family transcriptional regulator [Streptomyces sp. R301]NML77195.1 ROK family transcriptional regulator [Streptomyces sp. R302]
MRRDPGGGANLTALRGHNAALVLDLLRTAGEEGISRLELAARTGLTPQAVSKITARLRAEGMAAEAGRRASTGGKPRTVLRLAPEAAHAIGVHLDRDELTVALTDLTGTPLAVRHHPVTLSDGPPQVLEALVDAVRALMADPGLRVLGAGVAMPGPLGHREGVAGRVTGAAVWDGFPVREAVEGRLGVPVVLDKDTNAAALDLAVRPGAPRSFAYVHLGTGLGAGLVVGGVPLRGERTGAGELGHQTVQLDGPRCDCGARGCLEVLCLAAVARGELPEAARILGAGAANLVRLLDIDRVLLGGRVVLGAPEVFADGVAAVLADRRLPTPVEVTATPHAVARGAAQLVLAPVFGLTLPAYSSEERTMR